MQMAGGPPQNHASRGILIAVPRFGIKDERLTIAAAVKLKFIIHIHTLRPTTRTFLTKDHPSSTVLPFLRLKSFVLLPLKNRIRRLPTRKLPSVITLAWVEKLPPLDMTTSPSKMKLQGNGKKVR